MSEIVNLSEHRPMQPLFAVQVYRRHDGSLFSSIITADTRWLEETSDLGAKERVLLAAQMLETAPACLREFSEKLDDLTEPRAP